MSNRYRYQGAYSDNIYDVSVKAVYDVVSDPKMANQYNIQDFDLKTAGRTQLDLRRQDPWWTANLTTRVRVNNFQSINQELPSFHLSWHPLEIPRTGIIFGSDLQAGYLNYIFSRNVTPDTMHAAARAEIRPYLYRPFHFRNWNFTPEVGGIGIYYSDNQNNQQIGQGELFAGASLETAIHKTYARSKHVIEPYTCYQYLSSPTITNSDHFIFTIQDGLNRLNRFRCGVRNSLFFRDKCSVLRRGWVDLWGNLFIKSNKAFPDQRLYLNVEYQPFLNVNCGFFGAWNFQENMIDTANPRVEWTVNENAAFNLEYRHRSKYFWRKANFYNFVLENTRTQTELLGSVLSDQRDTLLFRLFFRFDPDWHVKLDVRSGWNRVNQPPYTEYSAQLGTVLFEHWRYNFTYEKRESDNRYSMSLRLDPGPPKKAKACPRF